MSLLEKLWDDTLAGPRPDTGLGRLRKLPSLPVRTDLVPEAAGTGGGGSGKELAEEESPRVTRSIMIRRTAGADPGNGSPPDSPAGSTPPLSPFFGSGGKEWNRFRRKSMSDAYERATARTPPTATATKAGTAGIGSRGRYPPCDV